MVTMDHHYSIYEINTMSVHVSVCRWRLFSSEIIKLMITLFRF
jgi:hypothetical protein